MKSLCIVLVLLLVGCRVRTPAEEDSRQKCLFKAEASKNERADKECIHEGYAWDAEHRARLVKKAEKAGDEAAALEAAELELCPVRADIMAELEREHGACSR